MEKSYLLDMIKSLQPDELQRLSLFLASPYFVQGVTGKETQALFQIILKAAPEFSEHKLEKDRVYKLLYPGKAVVEGKLKKLISELTKLVRHFLLIDYYRNAGNEFQRQVDLAQIFRSKGMISRHQQVIEKLRALGGEGAWESLAQYNQEYVVENEVHELESTYNQGKGDLNIPAVLNKLDRNYFANRLELLNRFWLQKKVAQLDPSDIMLARFEDLSIPTNYLERSILLQTVEKIHNLLRHPLAAAQDFQDLMSSLQKNEDRLAAETLQQFYTYLRNFCVLSIDAGNDELIPVMHNIQRDNLRRGYFYQTGKISPSAYLSINRIAIMANEVEWALQFTESHKDKVVGANETQEFYQLNMAICLFAQHKLEEALDIIPFGSSYSNYHIAARRLELKIYFELNSELLPYKIDAFRMHISRASQKFLSDSLRELHANFVNLLQQISQSPRRNKERSEYLIRRIQEKKWVAERHWLLEKARELAHS
jgi:hypothetical protein